MKEIYPPHCQRLQKVRRHKMEFLPRPPTGIKAVFVIALIFTCLCASAANSAAAPDLSVELELGSSHIELGQRVPVRIVVEGKGDFTEPTLADVPGLEIVFQGRSQSVQIMNMQVKASKTFTYIIVPQEAGEYVIGPARLESEGAVLESSAATLTVSAPAQPRQQAKEKSLFIEASVDNANPYLGQQVTLLFRFARSPDARIRNAAYDLPDLASFWSEGIESRREYSSKIKDKEYIVTEVAIPLFPIVEGEVTIGPIAVGYEELVVSQNQPVSPHFNDPFGKSIFDDDFFKMFRSESIVKRTARTAPITIHVRPLPQERRPAGFQGGVGKFSLSARLNDEEVKAGESVTLTLSLSGEGNIRDLSDPRLEMDSVKVYSDNPAINVKNYQDKIVGEKIYKLALVPQTTGVIEIPEMAIPYFNPDSGRYEFASSSPLEMRVLPAERESLVLKKPLSDGKESPVSARGDILPIHERIGDIRMDSTSVWLSRVRPLAYPLPLLIYAISYVFAKRKERLQTDAAYRRAKLAAKTADAFLADAGEAFARKDWNGVFSKCSRAISQYLAAKINVPSGGLTSADVRAALCSRGIPNQLVNEVTEFLEFCDFGRFTSSKKSPAVARECLEKAYRLLERLEKEEAIG